MSLRIRRWVFAAAAVFFIPAVIGAAPIAQPSEDLSQSYELLSTTSYSKVDSQKLLDGARAALAEHLRKKGVRIGVPSMHDAGSSQANVMQIANAIARVENATHDSNTALTYEAIDGMARALGDKYTAFFTPEQFRDFNRALDPDKISGIGVLLAADDSTKYVRAYYVVPGTPAEKAGLQSGDVFRAIDGVSLRGATTEQVQKLLRGAAGTPVKIDAQRAGKSLGVLSITRSEVQPPTVIYKLLPQQIGYIAVFAFGRETPDEFSLALERLQKSNVRGYVIDLRNDGGGYVNSALDISSKFIKGDPLLTIQERGPRSTTIDSGADALPRKPMAILVNGLTASASEITAGALQDDGIAMLVGERTYGKGVMQSLTELPDGAAIKITTAHYLTPKNRDINLKGIEPDYSVPENKDAIIGEIEHDAQLQAAVTILTKKIADAKP
jgi:carboxyl-terminal processing protease